MTLPTPNDELKALLKSFPADQMMHFKIGPHIGIVKYDDPQCIEPLA